MLLKLQRKTSLIIFAYNSKKHQIYPLEKLQIQGNDSNGIFAQFILVFGQGAITPNWVMYSILGVLIVSGLSALVGLTGKLIEMEGQKHGIQLQHEGWFTKLLNQFTGETKSSNHHKLSRGFDILLNGGISDYTIVARPVSRVALKPQNFVGISPIPKVVVEVGQNVKAGDEIYHDKKHPEIKYTSPVSGEILEVRRG